MALQTVPHSACAPVVSSMPVCEHPQDQTRNWNSERSEGAWLGGNRYFVMQELTTLTLAERKDLRTKLICYFCYLSIYAAQIHCSQRCGQVRSSRSPNHPATRAVPFVDTLQVWRFGAWGQKGAGVWVLLRQCWWPDPEGQNSHVWIHLFSWVLSSQGPWMQEGTGSSCKGPESKYLWLQSLLQLLHCALVGQKQPKTICKWMRMAVF